MPEGSDVIMGGGGTEEPSAVLRDYSAPEAEDSVYMEVARFLQFKRKDHAMDV